ncbi:hypothetical protein BPIT_06940 [Candidatus Brocadia pituitae]|nr:hypothetical protein BPIT_06940 [Candidatus Brocadia pituitae]
MWNIWYGYLRLKKAIEAMGEKGGYCHSNLVRCAVEPAQKYKNPMGNKVSETNERVTTFFPEMQL